MVDLWALYEQTEEGCNKECNKCPLLNKTKNVCLHDEMKSWEKWAKKRHEEFGEMSRVYE